MLWAGPGGIRRVVVTNMEQLGGLDAMFLSCETPTMHMHVCGLFILDTATMGPGDPFDRITAMLEARVPGIAPMRHRLSTVPLNLGRPFWTDDPDLHVERHLRRVVLDPPGDDRQLAELAGEFCSTQLRRDRPLWEMLLVEGLPDQARRALGEDAPLHHRRNHRGEPAGPALRPLSGGAAGRT